MTTFAIDTVLLGLLVVFGLVFFVRTPRVAPLRWRAYRLLRPIPTPLCLCGFAICCALAIGVLVSSRRFNIPGTPQQWTLDVSLMLMEVSLIIPACRFVTVEGRPRERKKDKTNQDEEEAKKRKPGEEGAAKPKVTYRVSFERVSGTEAGLHIRRTDGKWSILRQRLPRSVNNVHIALNALIDCHDPLVGCGVRSVRVASPDVTQKISNRIQQHIEEVKTNADKLDIDAERLRGLVWEELPAREFERSKRVILLWLRDREPLPDTTNRLWHAVVVLGAVFWPSAWVRTGKRMAQTWRASAEPMVERGWRVQLVSHSQPAQ